jgi:hypothetical protein
VSDQIAIFVHHRVPHGDVAHAIPECAAVARAPGLFHQFAVGIGVVGGFRLAAVPVIPLRFGEELFRILRDSRIILLAFSQQAEIRDWRRLGERPDPHALPPAPLAVGYLCVPADAQFIKALMRGLLPAIWAKAAEPFGTVAQMNCAAPGEVRH